MQALARDVPVAAVLPRVIWDREWNKVRSGLREAKRLGVTEALVGNIGMIEPVRREGMQVRGDFGLNVFNSGSADYYAAMGLSSLTASFELTLQSRFPRKFSLMVGFR